VTPDQVIGLKAEDFQNQFSAYRKAIRQVVESMAP
jgi:hypothetical protein